MNVVRMSREETLDELEMQISEVLLEVDGKFEKRPVGAQFPEGAELLGELIDGREILIVDHLLTQEQYTKLAALGCEPETYPSLLSYKRYGGSRALHLGFTPQPSRLQ